MEMASADGVRKHRARIACRWRIPEEILQSFKANHAESYRTTFKRVSTHKNLENRLLLHFVDAGNNFDANANPQGFEHGKAVIGFELFEMGETEFDAELRFSVEGPNSFKDEFKTTFKSDIKDNKGKEILVPGKKVEYVELCDIDDIFDPTKGYINNGEMVIVVEGFIYHNKKHIPIPMGICRNISLWRDDLDKTSEIHVGNQIIFLHYEVILRMFQYPKKQEKIKGQADTIEFPEGFSKRLVELIIKYHYYEPFVFNEELADLLEIHRFIVSYGKMGNLKILEQMIYSRLDESTVVQIHNYALGLPPPNPVINEEHDIQSLYKMSMQCLRSAIHKRSPVADFEKLPEASITELVFYMITTDFRSNNGIEAKDLYN